MYNIDAKINEVYYQLFGTVPLTFLFDIRYFVIYGGRRAGKSYDISQLLGLIVLKFPKMGIYVIRKVGRTLKQSVFKRHHDNFSAWGVLGSLVIENKTDMSFHVTYNGSFIKCVGFDDPEKFKSAEGIVIVHWEEASDFSESDFDTVDAGLSPTGYQAVHLLTHNPIPTVPGEQHWIQKRFLYIAHKMGKIAINPVQHFAVLKVNYTHNKECPEAVKKVLEGYKDKNPNLYKMWVLGEFTDHEGLIFPNFEVVSEVPNHLDFIGYGLDFGYSQDPVALLGVWGNSEELCIKGLLYAKGLTNPELVKRMLELGVDPGDTIVADSAEPKTIDELSNTFYAIEGVKKYKYYKTDTIRVIYGYRLSMVDNDIDLQRERASYCWQTNRQGKLINKPADGNDHYMDAFIMLCTAKLGRHGHEELEVLLG